MEKDPIFLIDASSFIFRAFFAIPNLSTKAGHPTNATYGFLSMLLGIIQNHKPKALICVYDSKEPTFRKERYAEYKSNRGAPPDLLVPQFDDIAKAVELLGVRSLRKSGFEADDLIGGLVHEFHEHPIRIVSGDKDLMQLVTDRVQVVDTMKNIFYGPAQVEEKFGVKPELITDYLGLVGDDSDNIPGVEGIGPKTAVALLKEYGSLEAVLAAAPNIKGKRGETLLKSAELARLSKELATVITDFKAMECGPCTLEECQLPQTISHELMEFLKTLELHSLAARLKTQWGANLQGGPDPTAASSTGPAASSSTGLVATSEQLPTAAAVNEYAISVTASAKLHGITTKPEWKKLFETLRSVPEFAFDTETKGLRARDIEMVGMSFCYNETDAYYIPLRHQQSELGQTQLSWDEIKGDVAELFHRNPTHNQVIIAQNLKYDLKVLKSEGLAQGYSFGMGQEFFDPLICHYLLDPESKHNLDAMSQSYLGQAKGDFEKLVEGKIDFSEVRIEDAIQYAARDAWLTYLLKKPLEAQMQKRSQVTPINSVHSLSGLFKNIEMPLVLILAQMEWDGIALDARVLDKLSIEFAAELKTLEAQIFEKAGQTFNLASPKQLSEILFQKLGLPVVRKTKTGFSTDVDVLEKLSSLHEVPALVLRVRELTKLKGTYVDVLPGLVEKDGRVHAQFNQTVAATGRLSSSNPNLQNIPIKTLTGRQVRKAFVASTGHDLVGADYSQVELRLVAHLSGDEVMKRAFLENADIHSLTAAEIFHIPLSNVSSDQRRIAKAINFGLIYGKTAFGLSEELGISRKEAVTYIETYFHRYAGVKKFMEDSVVAARKAGGATTIFGRERPIRDLMSKNVAVKNNAERMAINTPVQGSAADMMKKAMVDLAPHLDALNARMILQVHDELVLEVPHDKTEEARRRLTQTMENAVQLSVPVKTDSNIAVNWFDLG